MPDETDYGIPKEEYVRRIGLTLVIGTVLSLVAAACAPAASGPPVVQTVVVTAEAAAPEVEIQVAQAPGFGETLDAVEARGNLVCGVNGQLPAFSFLDPSGEMVGFDADFCQALAAAIFGDPSKVEYRALTTGERFVALQTGEIDVLMRNTTWTVTRDSELGLNFTVVTFYDGQGIMVPADSGFEKLSDLEGGTVCVQKGTTTELNLADAMAVGGISYTPATFEDANQTYGAYAEGRCDAVTSDKSQLNSAAKGLLPDPDEHVIMDVTLSKEPLGPVVRHGDDEWFDIVKWTVFATISAEEYGVNAANLDTQLETADNPNIRRLLGAEGELGTKFGLSDDFAYNVIKAVGNYAEIYNRHLGEGTVTYIPRGLNALYTNGGLLYSPPFR
jgi:general L-amino acid transport system substrate-binding protein